MPGNVRRGAALRRQLPVIDGTSHVSPAVIGSRNVMQAPKLIGDPRGKDGARELSEATPASAEPRPLQPNPPGGSSLESRWTGVELPAGIYRTIVAAYAWM